MSTIQCPVCGKENETDAIRCVECNQDLTLFARYGLSTNPTIKLHQDPDTQNRKKEQPPDRVESENKSETPENNTQSVNKGSSGGKLSRFKTILKGKSGEVDLEALRKEGLLPDDKQSVEPTPNASSPFTTPDESADYSSASTLPDWLSSAEFGKAEEHTGGVERISHADSDARPGDIPDWVRKLQTRFERHGPEMPEDEQPLPSQEHPSQPVSAVGFAPIDQLSIPAIPIKKIEPGLIESVTSYVTGLKISRRLIPDRGKRLSRISWGIIGLTMISLMAALIWSGSSVPVISGAIQPEMAAMTSFINTISPESVVLVGMEYDLPLAGEIENVALPVLVDLMSKQVNLVFLPTHPVGPAMANHLVELGKNWQPEYPGEKIFIFAYLPGGATGLLRFAIAPREALPIGANGTGSWLAPQLTTITKPSDFAMLLLLTDSSEAGKDWLEQVQPRLNEIPLFVVASSQAAPILRPYLESGQITAMVEGISGAAGYERVQQLTTNNQVLLRAYRGGLLFMAILLACVIILSLIAPNFLIKSPEWGHENASK